MFHVKLLCEKHVAGCCASAKVIAKTFLKLKCGCFMPRPQRETMQQETNWTPIIQVENSIFTMPPPCSRLPNEFASSIEPLLHPSDTLGRWPDVLSNMIPGTLEKNCVLGSLLTELVLDSEISGWSDSGVVLLFSRQRLFTKTKNGLRLKSCGVAAQELGESPFPPVNEYTWLFKSHVFFHLFLADLLHLLRCGVAAGLKYYDGQGKLVSRSWNGTDIVLQYTFSVLRFIL